MLPVLVTGGCGFIGSNFIRYLIEADPGVSVINLDLLTYAGNQGNLADLTDEPRYRFVRGDIADAVAVRKLVGGGVSAVINFAAESHVDRSINDAAPFVRTNVCGTQVLLDAAREFQVERYLQISTDEVYGSLGPRGHFVEETPLAPNSPYAASKAGADLLVRSYAHTFGLPALITRCSNNYGPYQFPEKVLPLFISNLLVRSYVQTFGLPALITRCSNNYGPYQFPEKLIPLFITNLLHDEPVPVYGDGLNVRDWIHVRDHCAAIERIWRSGRVGEVYNIGSRCERTNLELTNTLLEVTGKPRTLIRFIKDRPGHDRRYAIDPSKLERELAWRPKIPFNEGLRDTVRWYQEHSDWVANIRTGEYLKYYQMHYGNSQ